MHGGIGVSPLILIPNYSKLEEFCFKHQIRILIKKRSQVQGLDHQRDQKNTNSTKPAQETKNNIEHPPKQP